MTNNLEMINALPITPLLFIATVLLLTGAVMAGFAYVMLRNEHRAERTVERLACALEAHTVADQARPWHNTGPDNLPRNIGPYQVRSIWQPERSFLAWFDGRDWLDYMDRDRLFTQDLQWRKLIRINTMA